MRIDSSDAVLGHCGCSLARRGSGWRQRVQVAGRSGLSASGLLKPGTRTRAQVAGQAVRIQGVFRADSGQGQGQGQGRPIDAARDITPTGRVNTQMALVGQITVRISTS